MPIKSLCTEWMEKDRCARIFGPRQFFWKLSEHVKPEKRLFLTAKKARSSDFGSTSNCATLPVPFPVSGFPVKRPRVRYCQKENTTTSMHVGQEEC